jgi:hypothetical protein
LRPDLIKALGITDQQQKDMKELNDVFQEKMKNNVTVINMQYSTPEGRQARIKEQQDETLKMKKIFGEFLLKVLTQDQRDKFEKMQGAKIDTGSSTLTLEGRGRGG